MELGTLGRLVNFVLLKERTCFAVEGLRERTLSM